jgi:hypothetical protein
VASSLYYVSIVNDLAWLNRIEAIEAVRRPQVFLLIWDKWTREMDVAAAGF